MNTDAPPYTDVPALLAHLGVNEHNAFVIESSVRGIVWKNVLYVDDEGAVSTLGLEDHRVTHACAEHLLALGAREINHVAEAFTSG